MADRDSTTYGFSKADAEGLLSGGLEGQSSAYIEYPRNTSSSSSSRRYVGQTDGSGIAARSGTSVSSGNVDLYQVVSGTLTSLSETVQCYNFSATAIAASTYVFVEKDSKGIWWVTAEDCT